MNTFIALKMDKCVNLTINNDDDKKIIFVHLLQMHRRFRELGIRYTPHERVINLTVNQEILIMNLIIEDPTLSTRRVGRIAGVSHSLVWRNWKRYGLHPYHYRKVQGLLPADNFARMAYCQRVNELLMGNPALISKILWMDEAQFTRAGIFNSKNQHEWQEENPKQTWESSYQTEFSINMWAGILNNQLIGPIEIPRRLNSENYLHFLRNIEILEHFEDINLETLRTMWIQHDGAPAHYGIEVRNYLNNNYPGRWIGRGSQTLAWPARSPDLTPLDFYVWGTLKSKVYAEKILTREHLMERINRAADEMRAVQINLNRHIRQRLNLCLEFNGGHFENEIN